MPGWNSIWSDRRAVNLFSSFFRARPAKHPAFTVNRQLFSGNDQGRPVAEYEYVAFDTELTGLNRRRDQIVAIGAVRIRKLQILPGEVFHSYVRPTIPLPKNSTLIHRITPQVLENAPHLREVLPAFVDFCGPALLVGHHVNLDAAFLNRAARRLFDAGISNPGIDTIRLARLYTESLWQQYHDQFNLQVSYNLGDLARRYGLPVFAQHHALQDALQTAYLFLFLVRKMQQRGCQTLGDLFRAGESWKQIF
jgi:DNA polymerase III subunit epsilon